jgi:transglutaminase-like putative cysteine protease
MKSRTSVAVAATVATGLGALSLLPTYSDLRWLPVTWGAVLVVGVVAQGARLLGVPVLLAPVLAVAGLAGYVTAVYAHSVAVLGVLPGSSARAVLGDITSQGWHDVSVLRAPVPSSQGLVLLTVCGVGLVAVAVDLIAVVGRRPALAGLPLLALFAVSAATVPHGVGWLPFVYAGAGYVILLLTESSDRISRWGHPLGLGNVGSPGDQPAIHQERAQTAPLVQVGRRVGVAAIAVAVVVPGLIPGLHAGLFGTSSGHGNGFGSGNSTVTTYNPILNIKGQLTKRTKIPLLQYHSNDPDPAYLRMTALDEFDGNGWTQGDLTAPSSQAVTKGLPTPVGLSSEVHSYTVTSSVRATDNLKIPWLPVPYPATSVTVDKGDWRWDGASGAIFSTQTTTLNRSWGSTSERLQPTKAQLTSASVTHPKLVDRDLVIRLGTVPKVLADTATQVTKHAKTPFDKAVALQNYFHTSHFTYDLNAPQNDGSDVLAQFLQNGRGYCVQFAAAMALMARTLKIPARVAIGFTHGTQQPDGSYLITTLDAHAWPELYFNNIGWLAFEPTPRGDGQAALPAYTQPHAATPVGGVSPGTEATPGPAPTPRASLPSGLLRGLDDPPAAVFPHSHPHHSWTGVLFGLLGLAILAIAPAAGRWLTRRRRWGAAETGAARAHAAWRELIDDARDLGFRWHAADSPRRAMGRLVAVSGLSQTSAELSRLAAAEERARYARNITEPGELAADERAVRRELASIAGPRRRVSAVVLPRSTVATTVSFVANRIADLFDFVDTAIAFVYRLVTPRRLRRT